MGAWGGRAGFHWEAGELRARERCYLSPSQKGGMRTGCGGAPTECSGSWSQVEKSGKQQARVGDRRKGILLSIYECAVLAFSGEASGKM